MQFLVRLMARGRLLHQIRFCIGMRFKDVDTGGRDFVIICCYLLTVTTSCKRGMSKEMRYRGKVLVLFPPHSVMYINWSARMFSSALFFLPSKWEYGCILLLYPAQNQCCLFYFFSFEQRHHSFWKYEETMLLLVSTLQC